MKDKFKVYVLGDKKRMQDLKDKYSFIENLDEKYSIEPDMDSADFLIIDLDIPHKDTEEIVVTGINRLFSCRPILFVSFGRESCLSVKAEEKVPFLKNFCKNDPFPVCKSSSELQEALRWYRFLFKDNLADMQKGIRQQAVQFVQAFLEPRGMYSN